MAIALAIATRCCSPPESWLGKLLNLFFSQIDPTTLWLVQ